MEQVFDLVNGLLRRDRETKRRDLGMRGYKIIPLSNQAGLLEFVGNTAPMREWLTRAHPRQALFDVFNQPKLILLPATIQLISNLKRCSQTWETFKKNLKANTTSKSKISSI